MLTSSRQDVGVPKAQSQAQGVVMMLVATTVALLLLLGFSTSQGAAAAVNGLGAAAAVDGPRPRSFFWFNDVTPALPPFPPHQPPLPPSPPPPHPPLPPLAPPPPSPPPDEFDCHDLGGFDATMFRGMMSQYMERFYGSLPTAPREGREYRRLGTMEIVRYNLSYTNIELGEAKLLGCRNKGANKWCVATLSPPGDATLLRAQRQRPDRGRAVPADCPAWLACGS